jgi:hypothetical protein
MNRDAASNFDSIESAHEFVGLLSETVMQVKKEVDADVERALDSQYPRRLEALRMVSYNLEKLAVHMNKSCRILNDLRSLRRLLFEERTAVAARPLTIVKANLPGAPARPTAPATVVAAAPGRGRVVTA